MGLNKKRLVTYAVSLGLILAGVAAATADDLKIGSVNPSSGGLALYGDEVTRGYELAADWVNSKGGVLGRKVDIIRGNASTPQEGIAAVEQFRATKSTRSSALTLAPSPARLRRRRSTTTSSIGTPTRWRRS